MEKIRRQSIGSVLQLTNAEKEKRIEERLLKKKKEEELRIEAKNSRRAYQQNLYKVLHVQHESKGDDEPQNPKNSQNPNKPPFYKRKKRTYYKMVMDAVQSFKNPAFIPSITIHKHIKENYNLGDISESLKKTYIRKGIKRAVACGALMKAGVGSYKIPDPIVTSTSGAKPEETKKAETGRKATRQQIYYRMVLEAAKNLKNRKGFSRQKIGKYIDSHFTIKYNKTRKNRCICHAIREAVTSGDLMRVSGAGASGHFKIPIADEPVSKRTAKRTDSTVAKATSRAGASGRFKIKKACKSVSKTMAKKTGSTVVKARVAEKTTSRPTYAEMTKEAVKTLKGRQGASRHAIYKFLQENYNIESPKKFLFNSALRNSVASGILIRISGRGANGCFKIPKP